MNPIRELWCWLGDHQAAAITVMVLVAVLIALAMVIEYDMIGALRQLGELMGQ